MSWELQVRHGADTLTYTNIRFEDEDYTIDEAANTDSVEFSDIEIFLDGDFLGATDIDDLPADSGSGIRNWRARLLYNGVEYLNGIIKRWDGVVWEPDFQRWSIRIENYAEEDFVKRLEEVQLATEGATPEEGHIIDSELEAALPAGTLTYGKGLDSNNRPYYQYCYKVNGIWEAIKDIIDTKQIGGGSVSITQPGDLFEYTVRYNDGTDKEITRTPTVCIDCFAFPLKYRIDTPSGRLVSPLDREASLPLWNARDFFEAIQAYHGWSIRASYDSFPSRQINVDLIENKWVGPTNPPVLDGRVEEEGLESYSILSPEYPDLGVKYQWIDHYGHGKYVNWLGKEYSPEFEDPLHDEGFFKSAPMFYYAAVDKSFDRNGDPNNEDLIDLPFHLPYLWYLNISDAITPDAVNHPNYSEVVWWARLYTIPEQAIGEPHIFELVTGVDDGNPNEGYICQGRVPQTAGEDQFKLLLSIAPSHVIENHEIATSELIQLVARFDLEDASPSSYRVGNSKFGVRFLGDDYMVSKRVESPQMKGVEFSLVRISSAVDQTPTLVEQEEHSLSPLELSVTGACVNDEFSFDLQWVEPTGSLVVSRYEIEYRPYYKQTWQQLGSFAPGTTSTSFTEEAFGEERGVFFFRIRSIYANDTSSISPWVSALAEVPTCGASGGGEEVEEPCYEELRGSATIQAGETSVTVIPSPSLSIALNFGSAGEDPQTINILATPQSGISPATHWRTGNRTSYSFDIILDAAPSSDVRFSWEITRLKTSLEHCYPCWRIDKWYDFPNGNDQVCTDFAANPFQYYMWDAHMHPAIFNSEGVVYLLRQWFGSYATGGHAQSALSEIELISYTPPRWNFSTGAMEGNTYDTTLTNLPIQATSGELYATAYGENFLWVAIVQDNAGDLETWLYRYEIATDTWTQMATLGSARTGAALVYMNGDLHLIGGQSTEGPSAADPETHFIYDIGTDTWANGPRIFPGTYDYVHAASGIEYGGSIYLIGGRKVPAETDPAGASTDQLEILRYNGTSWAGTGASLPERKDFPRIAKKFGSGASIHVVGGYNSGTTTSKTHFRFTPVGTLVDHPKIYSDPAGAANAIEGFGFVGYVPQKNGTNSNYIFLALGGLDDVPTSASDGHNLAGCYSPFEKAINPFDGIAAV